MCGFPKTHFQDVFMAKLTLTTSVVAEHNFTARLSPV